MSGYKYYDEGYSPRTSTPVEKDLSYFQEYKHLLGCVIKVDLREDNKFAYISESSLPKVIENLDKILFFKDETTLTTYRNYMSFHYPEIKI